MDFYCPAERLCIELDGDSHDAPEAQAHDASRDEFLANHSITVLRFRNDEIYSHLERVLEDIRTVWTSKTAPVKQGRSAMERT